MADNDEVLWERARAGDATAFGALYERHGRAVYSFCFWRTSDSALAEDLSAAVFLEVWAARGRTTLTQPSLLPWLLGVAHNLVRNQWRSTRRLRAALARLPPLRDAPDHGDDVAERVDAERGMRAVRAACERLPRREREVLELCVWMELSPTEAATVLRIPGGYRALAAASGEGPTTGIDPGIDPGSGTNPIVGGAGGITTGARRAGPDGGCGFSVAGFRGGRRDGEAPRSAGAGPLHR